MQEKSDSENNAHVWSHMDEYAVFTDVIGDAMCPTCHCAWLCDTWLGYQQKMGVPEYAPQNPSNVFSLSDTSSADPVGSSVVGQVTQLGKHSHSAPVSDHKTSTESMGGHIPMVMINQRTKVERSWDQTKSINHGEPLVTCQPTSTIYSPQLWPCPGPGFTIAPLELGGTLGAHDILSTEIQEDRKSVV